MTLVMIGVHLDSQKWHGKVRDGGEGMLLCFTLLLVRKLPEEENTLPSI